MRDSGARMRDAMQSLDPSVEVASPAGEAGGWRLPSGEDLISFALGVGLAAGPLAAIDGAAPARRTVLSQAPKTRRRRVNGRAARAGSEGKEVK